MARQLANIAFTHISSGLWTLTVDGVDRPVLAIRDGRNWIVQAHSTRRKDHLETVHGKFRTLRDARSLMVAVWLAMDSMRNLDHYAAWEEDYSRSIPFAIWLVGNHRSRQAVLDLGPDATPQQKAEVLNTLIAKHL